MLRSLFVSLVLVSLAVPAAAVETYSYKTRGDQANASFGTSDECKYSYVDVWGAEESTKAGPGQPKKSDFAYASAYGYDWCTGESFWAWGSADGIFDGNGTQGASFVGTIPMFSEVCSMTGETYEVCDDWSGECWLEYVWTCEVTEHTLVLDVAISPEGDIYRGMNNSTGHSRYFRSHYRSVGQYAAGAVSGSATFDGENLLTDGSYAWGSLGRYSQGSHDVYLYN